MDGKALNNSILQLAVQGMLVPQDPTDEPASVLLERIRKERAKLIKEKKIKAPKGGESVIWKDENGCWLEKRSGVVCNITDEIPFKIPENWAWARVSSVFDLTRGGGIQRSEVVPSGLPCVRYGELYTTYETTITKVRSHTTRDVFEKSQKLCDGEVVATLTGENDIDIGRAVVNKTGSTIAFGGDLLALKGNYLNGDFAMYCLNSPYVGKQRTAAATGNIIVHLSGDKIGRFLLPIPPLSEQRRIVTAIKGAAPFVEEYNTFETARKELDAALPDRLRKSILQLAVQGKLVPQDPTDEPASVLLERIRKERAKLIKEKKIKAPKGGESVIWKDENGCWLEKRNGVVCDITEEIPFEIPESWEWARFGALVENHDSKRQPVEKSKRATIYGIYDYYGATGAIDKVDDYLFDGDYLMIGEDGGNFFVSRDNSFIAEGKFWANNHVHVVSTLGCCLRYLKSVLDLCNFPAMGLITGIAVPKLNQANLNSILVPVPPVNEQQRIVARITKLKALASLLEDVTNR